MFSTSPSRFVLWGFYNPYSYYPQHLLMALFVPESEYESRKPDKLYRMWGYGYEPIQRFKEIRIDAGHESRVFPHFLNKKRFIPDFRKTVLCIGDAPLYCFQCDDNIGTIIWGSRAFVGSILATKLSGMDINPLFWPEILETYPNLRMDEEGNIISNKLIKPDFGI